MEAIGSPPRTSLEGGIADGNGEVSDNSLNQNLNSQGRLDEKTKREGLREGLV